MRDLRVVLVAVCACATVGFADDGFQLLGTYKGLGGLVASAVGPGPTAGSQRFYLSYLYLDNTIDVVAVDPDTGAFRVFPNPAAGESGARCIAVGPDGNVYLGTLPRAHLLKLDPKAATLVDLGRPSPTEQYIWDVAFGPDGKLYGATYPQSKLVRYDPASGRLEDLGRMDPVEQYAHYVAGADGFVYVGIGTSKANIAAYEIATGRHREILPAEYQAVAQASVYRGGDGKVYGKVGAHLFRLQGWTAAPIGTGEAAAPEANNVLRDGRTVAVQGRTIRVSDPKSGRVSEHPFDYEGNGLPVFRVGLGPDGVLYGSSVLPIHFLKVDEKGGGIRELGDLGGGEIYSFLSREKRLLAAAYSGVAPLMVFDPSKPFSREAANANPALVNFAGSDSGWRPQALINGPGGRVYIGSVAGYGKLGGPLSVWDVGAGRVEQYPQLVTDQSVVSLAVWNGRIVGGTTVGGGGGSHPTQKEAKVFLWDPEKRAKMFEIVPIAGAGSITDLITGRDGLVYGIAGRTLFALDPKTREVKTRRELPFSGVVYNSVGLGADGRIWGLAADGIFTIDENAVKLVAKAPKKITGGFAMDHGSIYLICGASVYKYRVER